MRVVLEAQHACTANIHGISYYTMELIRNLLSRKVFDYELTFFDKNRERGNFEIINKLFGSFPVPIYECNTLSYMDIVNANPVFIEKSYNDYTGACGDIFHFMSLVGIPSKLNGKMVVTVHDMIPVKYPEYTPDVFISRFNNNLDILKQTEAFVITDSISSRNDFLEFLPDYKTRAFAIHCGYNRDICYLEKNDSITRGYGIYGEYILFLGKGIRKKCDHIIKAFGIVAERHKDIKLVLAGRLSEDYDTITRLISESRYKERVVLTGEVSNDEKRALYSGATVFVFPSLYEGFGLPPLEAMACGCPVITSDNSSLPEVVGDAGILVDPMDIEQIACEIEHVLTSDTLRSEMRIKGFEQSKKFTWEKTAEETEKVYKLVYEYR